jgi:uncharacterized membrane protein YeaQ/YmgE (transglycosylase-associated protein family)
MNLLLFIVLGGIAGWLASIIMHTNARQGVLLNIVVGIVGAFLGGLLFNLLGARGVTGFNLWSLVVALVGAVVLLAIVRAVRR